MSREEFTQRSELLQEYLEIESRWAGRASGFVRRASKVTAAVFVKMLVLGLLGNGAASLSELVQVGRRLGVEVSESGLAQRMGEAGVELLRCLVQVGLARLTAQALPDARVLVGFQAVNIVDSTYLRLAARCAAVFKGSGGSASVAGAKLQVVFDYVRGTFRALDLGSGHLPDQCCTRIAEFAQANSLNLFDLGYFSQALLQTIARQGGFFVTRLKPHTHVYWQASDAAPADLAAYLEQQPAAQSEVLVFLGTAARLPVRLIYARLPPDQAAQARRRARRTAQKHGRTCTQAHLTLLGWHLCITNVPALRWTPGQVLTVYRLRWQIELVFKLWKSQAQFACIRYQRPDHVQCLLYARLLGLLIFHWLVAPYRTLNQTELSFPKALRLFQQSVPSLIRRIAHGWTRVPQLLAGFIRKANRFAQKSSRHRAPSTHCRLLLAGI